MGRLAWQAHAPTHLTMAATIQQQLDTLEGNAWDTMPDSTPTESGTCRGGSSTASLFFGGRLVHAVCVIREYMLLAAERYESSADNAIRTGVCMANNHLYECHKVSM